ncbi:polymorphic toxin-type HINT domain-containing protein [Actinoplanes sp. NPDC051411]|uniref:polymorphic toxin-type HINT domain-containing protein n=1 Tax=Actinoplanes sp. NPDC051411 TaxID=3155522 RepID=UPI0034331126
MSVYRHRSGACVRGHKAGDKVQATDPTTGKTTSQTVTAIHVDHDKALTDLTVKVKGRNTVVHTTQQHPFWDKTRKMWVGAGDLAPSDKVATGDGSAAVVAVVNFAAARDMYDLTVSAVHTFYIVAGYTPVIVHNCPGGTDAQGNACSCSKSLAAKFGIKGGQGGVYTIHLPGRAKYVGMSLNDVAGRVNASVSSASHSVYKAGYREQDVLNVTFVPLTGFSRTVLRTIEQTTMDSLTNMGFNVVNTRNPEIRLPS